MATEAFLSIYHYFLPRSKLVYHAVKESEGSHSEEAHTDGDYEVCFDNRMSTWAEKVLWFEVTVHDPVDDYYDDYIGLCKRF